MPPIFAVILHSLIKASLFILLSGQYAATRRCLTPVNTVSVICQIGVYNLKICWRCHLCIASKNVHTFVVIDSSWTLMHMDLPRSLIDLTSVVLRVILDNICHSVCLLDVSRLAQRVRCQIDWLVEQAVEGLRVWLERLTNLRLGYSQLLKQGFEDGDMKHVV